MCTSIVINKNKTFVCWNLDILDMQHKVVAENDKVYIAVWSEGPGWLPLFGANSRGDFVAMPTCWPYDGRSEPSAEKTNIIRLNIELLFGVKTLDEVRALAESGGICSEAGVTFMAQLSDKTGNVLQVIPGQGARYFEKPEYSVLTNFSPFKGNSETHPWMGLDRYEKAVEMIEGHAGDFTVADCFDILKATSQTVCPTVVSMVFDVQENTVYWCEDRCWDNIGQHKMQ